MILFKSILSVHKKIPRQTLCG